MKRYIGWRGSGKTSNIIQDAITDTCNGARTLIITPTKATSKSISNIIKGYNDIWLRELYVAIASDAMDLDYSNFDVVYIDDLSLCLKQMFPCLRGYSDTNYDNYD